MAKRQIDLPSDATSVEILHLTDIHAGAKEYKDQDNKAKIKDADRHRTLGRLTLYLRELPKPPDFVIISGDITIAGDPQGMTDVRAWLEQGIREKILPPADHIIVTPGNHDVTWLKHPTDKSDTRYDLFFDNFGKSFPHAYLPGHDPAGGSSFSTLRSMDTFGGIEIKTEFGNSKLVRSWPFLLDLKSNVLIYAFNSTLACGTFLPLDAVIEKSLEALQTLYQKSPEPLHVLKTVQEAYRSSRLVDAPLVGQFQIDAFTRTVKHLQKELGEKYQRLTKIATLHHHISHLWRQQMEAKSFEAIIDAAQVRQALTEQQFDLVLHGHKHQNQISLDSQVVPISKKQSLSPICIVSGGTVGAYPRMGDRPTFKLISLKSSRRPRSDAIIREVPLIDADPRIVMATETKIYQIPLSKELPAVHDISQLKSKLDEFVFQKEAGALLRRKGVVVHKRGEWEMPISDPDIVSEGYKYEFFAVISSAKERTFVDVFLAEGRLNFRQRARIHWMLNDVKSLNDGNSINRVRLIIGNLEATHFSRSLVPGEIGASVDELKKWFAPAIKNGLLELKSSVISQRDVDHLGKTISFDEPHEPLK